MLTNPCSGFQECLLSRGNADPKKAGVMAWLSLGMRESCEVDCASRCGLKGRSSPKQINCVEAYLQLSHYLVWRQDRHRFHACPSIAVGFAEEWHRKTLAGNPFVDFRSVRWDLIYKAINRGSFSIGKFLIRIREPRSIQILFDSWQFWPVIYRSGISGFSCRKVVIGFSVR